MKCWCGVSKAYFAPIPKGGCDGHGYFDCHCGGDLCVCHWHGEIECPGCPDCEPEDEDEGDE